MKKIITLMLVLASMVSCASPITSIPDQTDRMPQVGDIVQPFDVALVVVETPEKAVEVTPKNFLVLESLGEVVLVKAPESMIADQFHYTVIEQEMFGKVFKYLQIKAIKVKNLDGTTIGWVPAWNVRF